MGRCNGPLLGGVVLQLAAACALAASAPAVAGARGPGSGVAAVQGLLQRLVPSHASLFQLRLMEPSECHGKTKLCFGYAASATHAGKVALAGTSGVELAMAANHYLKY